jgi:hypothetical protein
MTQQFPWWAQPPDILAEAPEATFFSFQDQFGQGQNQKNFFRGQFKNIFNQFLGTLGQEVRQGQFPTGKFTDFLGDFDFNQQFAQTAPSLRGGQTGRFAPPTRFLPF